MSPAFRRSRRSGFRSVGTNEPSHDMCCTGKSHLPNNVAECRAGATTARDLFVQGPACIYSGVAGLSADQEHPVIAQAVPQTRRTNIPSVAPVNFAQNAKRSSLPPSSARDFMTRTWKRGHGTRINEVGPRSYWTWPDSCHSLRPLPATS
ncbi:hypothetical protein OH76DRAFT_228696 [Lentinus brumalis]|uniref:Uncharacterized protein n=1 Tax=Lentinus brumalis TaxID=2498619 RepID=A0A371DHA1_9APHY|nr:hypothetical protein OH76DRAFT_228696 [Polyporus brumalis]